MGPKLSAVVEELLAGWAASYLELANCFDELYPGPAKPPAEAP